MADDHELRAGSKVELADVLEELEAFHELMYDSALRIEKSVESIRQNVTVIAILLILFALVGGGLAWIVVVTPGS